MTVAKNVQTAIASVNIRAAKRWAVMRVAKSSGAEILTTSETAITFARSADEIQAKTWRTIGVRRQGKIAYRSEVRESERAGNVFLAWAADYVVGITPVITGPEPLI